MTIGKLTTKGVVAGIAIIALGGFAGCGAQPSESAAPNPAPSMSAQTPGSSPGTGTPSPSVPASSAPAPTPTTPTPKIKPTTPTSKPKPATPTPKPEPTKTEQVKAPALLENGSTGDQVRELQSRLKQIGWFTGKIFTSYGGQTGTAVKGFQGKRDLPQTGEVDQKTWDALLQMTRKPTGDELHNRLTAGPALMKQGSRGDQVRELQARLKSIGWYSGDISGYYGTETTSDVKEFQQKREIPQTGEVDQRSWDRLAGMTRTPTDDELHNVKPKVVKPKVVKPKPKKEQPAIKATGLDSRCLTGRVICISKAQNQLVWVVDGKAKLRVDVRFGSDETPTREGVFSVFMKSRDHVSTLFHTSMPYAMFFSGGQAVHYSPDFAARGYNGASHGCVNVRNKEGVIWLFDQVRIGDAVVVYS